MGIDLQWMLKAFETQLNLVIWMKEIKGQAGANLVIFISWTILWELIADSGEMDGISSGAIMPGKNFAVETKFL